MRTAITRLDRNLQLGRNGGESRWLVSHRQREQSHEVAIPGHEHRAKAYMIIFASEKNRDTPGPSLAHELQALEQRRVPGARPARWTDSGFGIRANLSAANPGRVVRISDSSQSGDAHLDEQRDHGFRSDEW
jgi:hypothetical protein